MSQTFNFKEFCQQIADGANPADFATTWGAKQTWFPVTDSFMSDITQAEFRKIQKYIKVNGWDVPAPLDKEPAEGAKYWFVHLCHDEFATHDFYNPKTLFDQKIFNRGIMHSTRENATRHALAMLNRNPDDWEQCSDK